MTAPVNLHTRTWGQQGVFSKAQNVNRATAETCCREIFSNILVIIVNSLLRRSEELRNT